MIARPEPDADTERVAAAEAALQALGVRGARVHAHGEVARLELPGADLERLTATGDREAVVAAVRAVGFRFVSIDLEAPGGR